MNGTEAGTHESSIEGSLYDTVPDNVRTKYAGIALQDIHGLVSIGGIAQFACEHDMTIEEVEIDDYRDWSVIHASGGVGGVGEDQLEWAVEELLDPDSTYDTDEARYLFQMLVNERLEARDAHRD